MKENIIAETAGSGEKPRIRTGPEDIKMFSALVRKLGRVKEAQGSSGRVLQAAESEVWRQLRQVADGIPVTKSGGTD